MSQNELVEVVMPLMGEGVNEATLVKWLKNKGEAIAKDEPLLEVSTDKVDTEIPSPADGFLLATFADAGATVAVNETLAHIGTTDATEIKDAPSKSQPRSDKKQQEPRKPSVQAKEEGEQMATNAGPLVSSLTNVKSSPLVRKIAKEHSINLNQLTGSGLSGRITKKDILQYLEDPRRKSQGSPSATSEGSARLTTDVVNGQETLDSVPVRRESMSKMRRLIADHMVASVRTSPHVTTVFEVELSSVAKIRAASQQAFTEREGFKLTYTPFFIYAAVQALKEHPLLNSSVDGYDILHKSHINIGCAVAIDSGLIVPVIKNAEELSLLGVCKRLQDLVVRARSKKLQPDDVRGGTFSITNPGGFGCITSNPIINQPQVAILGIGAVVKRPVVVADDAIAVKPMMMVSLTFDHRVVDGEGGARYLASFKRNLENFSATPH